MASIQVGSSRFAIVDDCDLEFLSRFKWNYNGWAALAAKGPDGRHALMHRLVMGAKDGEEVDHINRDGLDNRKENLRLCNKAQNNMNRRSSRPNKLGARGVHTEMRSGKLWFTAQVFAGGRKVFRKRFRTLAEAKTAYDAAVKLHHGEFAFAD